MSATVVKSVTRRSYIEIYTQQVPVPSADGLHDNPIKKFAYMLKIQHDSTDEIEKENIELLESLISNGHISKSNIIRKNGDIIRIYGLRKDFKGKIYYDKAKGSPNREYVEDAAHVDLSALQNAVVRAKETVF